MANILLYGFVFVVYSCFTGIEGYRAAVEDTTLRLYFRNQSYIEVNAANASLLVPYLNLTENTLLHCHGYVQSTDSTYVDELIAAYLEGFPYNIIAADYRNVTMENYISAVVLANEVASVLTNSVSDLRDAGVDEDQFIITGFSMGAQIAGSIARSVNFTVPKLIAMEPAGPLYGFIEETISASDAACVKCIHTDVGLYGNIRICGHLDFYPNGGTREQPGCPLFSLEDPANTCSHSRSEEYMAESVMDPNGFLSVQCDSWSDFKEGACNNSIIIPMGDAASCNVTGTFYLLTNSSYPYALGLEGTVYDD